MKKIFITTIIIICSITVRSQQKGPIVKYPTIGKQCPYFKFDDVETFRKKKVSLDDFRGKWLIIDCWNQWCETCISGICRRDSMAPKFSDNLQFLIVGYNGSQYSQRSDDKGIRKLYADLHNQKGISTPIAFDSTFMNRFDIVGCPYIIIIDPKGIVRGLTWKIEEQDLEDFIAGRTPTLEQASRWHQKGSQYFNYHPNEKPED